MGSYNPPKKCFFTDKEAFAFNTDFDGIEYFIKIGEINKGFKLDGEIESSECLNRNKHILKGLILNNKWLIPNEKYIDDSILKMIIDTSEYPRTPKEKLDNLFLEFFKMQSVDGECIDIFKRMFQDDFYGKLYFKTTEECNYYIDVLVEKGLIETNKNSDQITMDYTITYAGLNYQIEITEAGLTSRNCFIAMSFGEGMDEIRSAIKQAIIETGFIPIIVDEIHVKSDVTINDEILASIKKSRFCISDFTQQKNGVYFEAGYALGRGLKVIYTCSKQDFLDNAHFDINHYLHILYETPEELKKRLIDKIEAWIKE
jgi:hypothetical protein